MTSNIKWIISSIMSGTSDLTSGGLFESEARANVVDG